MVKEPKVDGVFIKAIATPRQVAEELRRGQFIIEDRGYAMFNGTYTAVTPATLERLLRQGVVEERVIMAGRRWYHK